MTELNPPLCYRKARCSAKVTSHLWDVTDTREESPSPSSGVLPPLTAAFDMTLTPQEPHLGTNLRTSRPYLRCTQRVAPETHGGGTTSRLGPFINTNSVCNQPLLRGFTCRIPEPWQQEKANTVSPPPK